MIPDAAYELMESNPIMDDYLNRHDIESAAILTVTDDETADLIARHLSERIAGKVVVEVGGGIGLLALHMSNFAKHDFVIEANPAWTHLWMMFFMEKKPKNVTFIFGAAEELFESGFQADVGLFCTHSDASRMREVSARLATEVIDVYGEIVPTLKPELAALEKFRQ